MKAISTRVLKSVTVDEEKTTFTFKSSTYTTEQLTVDGVYKVTPGQTLLITITSVESE